MWFHRFQITGSTKYGKQYWIREEVEPRKSLTFLVQVTNKGLEADLQLFIDVSENHTFWYFTSICSLGNQRNKMN